MILPVFVSLDAADHMLSRKADAIWVAEVLSSWAARYIGAGEEAAAPVEPHEDGLVVVEETRELLAAKEDELARLNGALARLAEIG